MIRGTVESAILKVDSVEIYSRILHAQGTEGKGLRGIDCFKSFIFRLDVAESSELLYVNVYFHHEI